MVFAYLFTWHALHVLRGEHQAFAEMREEYLTKGDPDFATQTRYTTKVGFAGLVLLCMCVYVGRRGACLTQRNL